nr:uncharacterized protein LOC131771150 isoform X4 [Pocillopora verrucosa]XP_058942906.1 uncharacterized protein LOC131771150 isoform X4 [Pocillopora verrucosa]
MFHDTANGKSTRISALEHIHVDSSVNNVTVGVPPFGNVTIKWSFGQHNIERIVMALNSASKVIGKFHNGEYRCYKGGFLTETECQEHYSLTVDASGDIIIAMRNISHPYFGSYLISVYRGLDDKIDTLWIIVCKKAGTAAPMSTVISSTGVTIQVYETTNEPTVTTTPGTSNKSGAVIGGILGALFFIVLIGGIAFWFYKRRRRQRDC